MEISLFASFVALALSVLGAGIAVVTLRLQRSPPEVARLESKVSQLDLDVTEIADRINHWMRRDAVRSARAKNEAPPPALGNLSGAELKAQLRAVASAKGRDV